MKILCLILIVIFMISGVNADQIIIFGSNRDLLLQLESLQTNYINSSTDIAAVTDGLMSPFDEIRVAAIKIILIYRLDTIWRLHRNCLESVVGTSKKLEPIVDAVLSSPYKNERTIIELLPQENLQSLPLNADPPKPRARNGDIPLEDVLLDVAVKDIKNVKFVLQKETGMNMLKKFRLNNEQEKALQTP